MTNTGEHISNQVDDDLYAKIIELINKECVGKPAGIATATLAHVIANYIAAHCETEEETTHIALYYLPYIIEAASAMWEHHHPTNVPQH